MKTSGRVNLIITLFVVIILTSFKTYSQSYNGIYRISEDGKCFKMFDDSSKIYKVESEAVVSLCQFESLKKKYDKQSGYYHLSISLTEEGKTKFAAVTKECIGKSLAFIIDDVLLMAPVVQQEITVGKLQITGPDKKMLNRIVKYYQDFDKKDK